MKFDPTALMGSNPVAQLLNVMRSGGNPDALVQQLLGRSPQLQQIVAGKTPDQLMQVAENMCRERGTNVDAVLKQFGITR